MKTSLGIVLFNLVGCFLAVLITAITYYLGTAQ